MTQQPTTRADITEMGYTVGFREDLGRNRVYSAGFLGCALIGFSILNASPILFALGAGSLAYAVYSYPQIETGRPRIGASQYGVFIDGLGLIGWRDIRDIKRVSIAIRTLMTHELHLELARPLPDALLADWRKLAWYRLMMILPWRMSDDNIIRIPLDPLAGKPDEIERQFKRMWTYYRSQRSA